ncbi:MAG: alpha/beta hydrolase [Chitinophagaceae bacterium]
MNKLHVFLSIVIMATSVISRAQETPVIFKDFVFKNVTVRKNLLYRNSSIAGVKEKYCQFDFYEPADDKNHRRPLIIWLHGGGFKFGKKTSGGIPLWGKTFAQRGYVCASINYRLSKKHPLKNFEDLVEGCADAIEDLKQAIDYFKQHAADYGIDTNTIILGGNSAGGMIALQAAYSNPGQIKAFVHKSDTTTETYDEQKPIPVAAAINFWGAMFNLKWLQNAAVPIVSVHGKKDGIVPYDNKNGIYGSMAIRRAADSLQIPNAIKLYESYSHELQKHFNPLFAGRPAKKRWLEAGQFVADFLYKEVVEKKGKKHH